MPSQLLPGNFLSQIVLSTTSGTKIDLSARSNKVKIIVVYRGQFCPFCLGTLTDIQKSLTMLSQKGMEVIAVSADPVELAAKFVKDNGFTFTVACGLQEHQMHQLGLYVSDPKNYEVQTFRFAEPGYIVVKPDGIILYRAEASHPMGGRPNFGNIIAGYEWSLQNGKDHPEYVGHVWGNVKPAGHAGQTSQLLPGMNFPAMSFPLVQGGTADLSARSNKVKIIVVYRGQFCPFCLGTLKDIQNSLTMLSQKGMEVIAVSADPVEVAAKFVKDNGFSFPVACGLQEHQMHQLGLYVSDPKNYEVQTFRFAEPAYFVVKPDGVILYRAESSHPMGGRPNFGNIIAGYEWSLQNGKDHPEYVGHVWGNVKRTGTSQSVVLAGTPEWYKETLAKNEYICIVFYRGKWCPFCKAQLKDVQAVVDEMKRAGVAVYGHTAETQEQANAAQKEWGLDFDLIGNPDLSLAQFLAKEGIVAPVIQPDKRYQNSMVQPAIVFVRRRDGAVLFRWAHVPALSNLGGAKDRPVFQKVWELLSKKLNAPQSELPIKADSIPTGGIFSVLCRCSRKA